jgi:hypothetical protein
MYMKIISYKENKSDVKNLKSFIVASNMNIFNYVCGDTCSLLIKNQLSYEKIVINNYFDVILSADGNIEINESEKFNLLKNIKIETDIFEERAESITEIVEQEFKNEQLSKLEKIKEKVNNKNNIIGKRIFNSPIIRISY